MRDVQLAKKIQEVLDIQETRQDQLTAMLKLKLEDCSSEDGTVEYSFVPEPWMRNIYNGVHGGIVASVFDSGIGTAATALTDTFVTTADLTVSYQRPLFGKAFRMKLNYTHVGHRLVTCMGTMIDAETGEIAATAISTFATLKERPRGMQV